MCITGSIDLEASSIPLTESVRHVIRLMGQLLKTHTLSGGVNDFDEAHLVGREQLFPMGVLDCGIVRLSANEQLRRECTAQSGMCTCAEGVIMCVR